MSNIESSVPERSFLGHPSGLSVIILTGLWENAAVFGMRTVLVYYLVKQLHMTDAKAINFYAFFSASAFIGLIGAGLADKFLGLRWGVLIGLLLMASGLFLILLPEFLVPALVLIASGSGLIRPTLTGQVGLLYQNEDPRRDRAFTWYYIGINAGATAAPLVFGTIGETVGWLWSFAASGVGMLIATVIYLLGWRTLHDRQSAEQRVLASNHSEASQTTGITVVLSLIWAAGIFYWAAYGQLGGSVALWADSGLDRTVSVLGRSWTIPATWFQSVNPILIFILGPLASWLWKRKGHSAAVGSELSRMATGTLYLSGAFWILAAASMMWPHQTSWIWLVIAIVPLTMGEIYWTPVGLGLFSRLALGGFVAVFVGIFGFSMTAGFAASGLAGQYWSRVPPHIFFGAMAILSIVAAGIVLAARSLSARFRFSGSSRTTANLH